MATIKKACKGVSYPKSSSVSRRLKTGGSFPDLNKDGKVTKKDILIGRGVLPKTAKKGMKVKKAQKGITEPIVGGSKQLPRTGKQLPGLDAASIKKRAEKKAAQEKGKAEFKSFLDRGGRGSKMKTGGKMKKCAYGCK